MNFLESGLTTLGRVGMAIAVTSFLAGQCLFVVDGGQRALIFDRFSGLKPKVHTEGVNFKMPLLQYPILFEVRTSPKVINAKTGTKDLQIVTLDLRILYRPEIEYLNTLYLNLGRDYDERILPSIANEVLKSIIAQYNAEQLLTQREQVSKEIRERLTQRASEFHIILEDIALTHLVFGKEFTLACEQKQVAQQEAERAKYMVQQMEQEAYAAIIKAEGEAEAGRLMKEAVEKYGTTILEMRRLEASRKIADTLAKSPGVSYIPGGSSTLLSIPIH
jgi:prohibitin 1